MEYACSGKLYAQFVRSPLQPQLDVLNDAGQRLGVRKSTRRRPDVYQHKLSASNGRIGRDVVWLIRFDGPRDFYSRYWNEVGRPQHETADYD